MLFRSKFLDNGLIDLINEDQLSLALQNVTGKYSLEGIEEGAKVGSEEATYYGPNWDPADLQNIAYNITTVYGKSKQELIDRIEELYNKELAELEGTTKTETTSPFAELINKISCDI